MSRRLLAGYLTLTLLVLVVLEVPLGLAYARSVRRNLETKIERDAVSLASLADAALASGRSLRPVARIAAGYAARSGERLVVVDRTGRAVVDTDPAYPGERDFDTRTRPEILAALAGRVASGSRFSHTLGHGLLYVAVPVASGGTVHGAARVTYPTSRVDAQVRRTWALLVLVALVALAAVALVGLGIARWIGRPLAALGQVAARMGEGNLGERATEQGPPEVRAVARTLNETAAKLEALLRSQEDFVADASHQLRTPLTALRLRLENAAADGADVTDAIVETERLARLVDELLALARADANASPTEELELADLVRARVEAWTPFAAERSLELVADANGGARVRASRDRLEQVLDNLLANALDAAPAGTDVAVGVRRAGGAVELHVTDRGPGLAPDARAHAFDRFWTGKTGRGSGLGLAIVARLVAVDGGEIELRPASGGGVEAVVRLRPA